MNEQETGTASSPGKARTRSSVPDALAFATDPDSEHELREGLAGYRDAQVWPGGLAAAIAALGRGPGSRLLFVDLDEIAFPAGAIHELAMVCEMGTVVVALGSDSSARFSREVLRAGVSDYLVKPLRASAVREAATRAVGSGDESSVWGCVTEFVGSGGSGTSTLIAAVALIAAQRGRYVSLLDLSRPVSALAFLLDVEPAAGLEQLLEAAGTAAPDPQSVDAVRGHRSDRIALYGYRFGLAPASSPPTAGVRNLLGVLRRQSHLVLVDGLGDPQTRPEPLREADRRVVVVEPTPGGASRTVRLLDRLGEGPPLMMVRNHTREFGNGASLRAMRRVGLRMRPRVSVPYEPSLPSLCDRGWPKGVVPSTIEKTLTALTEELLAPVDAGESAAALPADPALGSGPRSQPEAAGATKTTRRRRSAFAALWSRRRPRSAQPRPV